MISESTRPRSSLRQRAERVKALRCKNLIAVLEHPTDHKNFGAFVRNVNALGVEKAYLVSNKKFLPEDWEGMRERHSLIQLSASAIKWTFVKVFKETGDCLDHLERNGFVSIVTSPHQKGKENVILHEGDYTVYKKLAVWFGTEGAGISDEAIRRSKLCVNIPMAGIIESFNLGTSSGIVLYEVAKQRRRYQELMRARPREKAINQSS